MKTAISVTALMSLASTALAVTTYDIVLFSDQFYGGSRASFNVPSGYACRSIPSSFNDRTRSITIDNTDDSDHGRKICNFFTDINCRGQQHSYTFQNSYSVGQIPAAYDKKYSSVSCGATA